MLPPLRAFPDPEVSSSSGLFLFGSFSPSNFISIRSRNANYHSGGRGDHKLPLRGKLTPSTAPSSTNQLHLSPAPSFTRAHGRIPPFSPSPPSKMRLSISFFPLPVAINAILTPCVTTGRERVMRLGGGLGESEIGQTQASVSRRRGWLGKSEQVWPSGPQPRRMRSKMGSLTESLFFAISSNSTVWAGFSRLGEMRGGWGK